MISNDSLEDDEDHEVMIEELIVKIDSLKSKYKYLLDEFKAE